MSDQNKDSGGHTDTGGGAFITGDLNTGGGDVIGRDNIVQGDNVRGAKGDARQSQGFINSADGPIQQNFGVQRTIDTHRGEYHEGGFDEREGVFISGVVYGPVVGTNAGTINAHYSEQFSPQAAPSPVRHVLIAVQQAQHTIRQQGNSDVADDIDAVIGALVSTLKAQDEEKMERRGTKLREAQTMLRTLAAAEPSLGALAEHLGRLT